VIYPTHSQDPTSKDKQSVDRNAAVSGAFEIGDFLESLKGYAHESSSSLNPDLSKPFLLQVALSRAFAILNRQEHDLCTKAEEDSELDLPVLSGSSNFPARIIVFSATKDDPSQTVPTMNSIFACHKKGITIDSVSIGSYSTSSLLQVAADITSGYHSQVRTISHLQSVLMSVLLVDAPLRQELRIPKLALVDHKATCFCHQRYASIGYVCSVCLAVFCEPCQPCKVCEVAFDISTLPNEVTLLSNSLSAVDS
jgi:transcription initiation factor TFIIH subunit 3